MKSPENSRYATVSRRAILKASLGAGAAALIPGLACGDNDEQVFAGATAEPVPTTTSTTPPPTTAAAADPTTAKPDTPAATGKPAVDGEMVISFTYTATFEGKNKPPYVAVWIEDAAGNLAETVSLWYERGRKGARWLDHLTRWYNVDEDRIAAGGADDAATISSATRQPGTYDVVWDGAVDGTPAPVGDYFICIEAVREDGPISLIREPFFLEGTLAPTPMVDVGELSAVAVRIDA